MPKAAKTRASAADGRTRTFDVRESRDELSDGNARFHARQRHPSACMNAKTERQMAVGSAADIEPIRIGKLRRIAVGGADAEMHVAAGRDCNAAQRGVLGGTAVSQLV